MTSRQVIVVGGGPAGLMAAGQASQAGARTILLEKMDSPGRKLRMTGKGRCNLTNIASQEEFISHFSSNGRFLRQAFSRFFSEDLITFLGLLGVKTVSERGGRVFPASEDAGQVTDALLAWIADQGVTLYTGMAVKGLQHGIGRVIGVTVAGGNVFRADAVVLATGGASYPGTGSTGDGYGMAETVGHSVVPIRPALVPLETGGDVAQRLQGLSLRNVLVRIRVDGRTDAEQFGEMLFTHFGVSGPVILTMSGRVVDALRLSRHVTLSIDLKPALDEKKLDARLLRDLDAHGKRQFRTLLKRLLPSKLLPICIDQTGIPANRLGHQITSDERGRLRSWLKDFRLDVTGHRPLREAIITAGGVETREVNPRTMGSRLMPGLYFAGELLDVDADTGGFNLQAAFSTGWVAGRSAAAGR